MKLPLVQHTLERLNIIRSSNAEVKSPVLFMTLICKDEIDIIETHIRFHKAMGVDGIIVTDNHSTDGTREVLERLKREGLVLEIIDEPRKEHLHHVYVNRMIELAIRKYHADWIINSDADEFYYSHSWNLKEQLPVKGVNVLRVYSNFYFPSPLKNKTTFIEGTDFVKRNFKLFELDLYGIDKNPATEYFIGEGSCPKVIHNTRDYVEITDGNHFVKMRNYNEVVPQNITLYHYHTRCYESLEAKAKKAIAAIEFNHDPNWNQGWRNFVSLYQQGKLEEFYNMRFGEGLKEKLIEAGVVCTDPSVYNFLKYKQII